MKHWLYCCQDCQAEQATITLLWRCPACGGLLDLNQDKVDRCWQIDAAQPGLWRYRSLLPVLPDQQVLTLGEGMTPLHSIVYEGMNLWLKHDYLCPTGSYKDRGAAMIVNRAAALGISSGVEDSSGNAGCALAAYCALAGIECRIFVPAATSASKLSQMEAYGADIVKITGTRQDVSQAVLHEAGEKPYLSHIYDPYFFQGTKTIAFEIYEQMQGQLPEQIILPAGHGTMLIGVWLGLSELLELGLISRLPALVAVQAEACAPLYAAWSGSENIAVKPTLAEGIAIEKPPRLKQMLQAVGQNDSLVVTVNESEIAASRKLAGRYGIFIEPTSAVVLAAAGYLNRKGLLSDRVLCLLSGHGLKSAS